MKKIQITLLTILVIATSSFTASFLWNPTIDEVTINFELPDEGTKGTLSGLKATIEFDQKDLATSKIEASVEVKTLNTGNVKKDEHLLSADFFNAEKYPTISFVSSSIKATSEGFIANGNITIKDSTKAIEIPFTFSEDQNGTGIFKGSMSIHTGDFGVTKASKSGKDRVMVTLSVPVKK